MQVRRQRVEYWYGGIHWIFNGKVHRDGDLPARYYFRDGILIIVVYCQHNELHRTTGPAFIDYKDKIKMYYYQHRGYGSLEKMLMVEACR